MDRYERRRLSVLCRHLAGRVKYLKGGDFRYKSDPESADCVKIIRYVIEKHTRYEIPINWVHELPTDLFNNGAKIIDPVVEDLDVGDLIFVRNPCTKSNRIAHVAIIASSRPFRVFHCSRKHGGTVIEKLTHFVNRYEQ